MPIWIRVTLSLVLSIIFVLINVFLGVICNRVLVLSTYVRQ